MLTSLNTNLDFVYIRPIYIDLLACSDETSIQEHSRPSNSQRFFRVLEVRSFPSEQKGLANLNIESISSTASGIRFRNSDATSGPYSPNLAPKLPRSAGWRKACNTDIHIQRDYDCFDRKLCRR